MKWRLQFQRQVKKVELSLEDKINTSESKRFATNKKNLVRLPTTITTGISCHNFIKRAADINTFLVFYPSSFYTQHP